jgi:hypothetical protein
VLHMGIAFLLPLAQGPPYKDSQRQLGPEITTKHAERELPRK